MSDGLYTMEGFGDGEDYQSYEPREDGCDPRVQSCTPDGYIPPAPVRKTAAKKSSSSTTVYSRPPTGSGEFGPSDESADEDSGSNHPAPLLSGAVEVGGLAFPKWALLGLAAAAAFVYFTTRKRKRRR